MDYATTDLVLAIVHHLLVFMLAGVLAFEIGTVTLTLKRDEILGVGRVDNRSGSLAVVIVVVGFIRATVAAEYRTLAQRHPPAIFDISCFPLLRTFCAEVKSPRLDDAPHSPRHSGCQRGICFE
jgi:hypothetical protein